jgi:hypothetical protein
MRKIGSVAALILSLGLAPALLGGCTSTVRLEVAPINIYAKLDANVRIQLDKEVQSLIAKNPDLF